MGDDDTHMSFTIKQKRQMRMTKRREQGHYNAADRFVLVADVNSAGVLRSIRTGTETFDHIWRIGKNNTTHFVLRLGQRWLVTSMFSAKMNDRGTVEMGPHKIFTTEDAAIMYASIMASQGKEIMTLLTVRLTGCDYRRCNDTTEWRWVRIESDHLTHN